MRAKAMGVPTTIKAIFALACTAGADGAAERMMEDPEQRIGRPRQLFTGSPGHSYVPLGGRG